MLIRSKSPLRISFGGGGTDVAPYSTDHGGCVISSTINKYSYATLIPNTSQKIVVKSFDLDSIDKYNMAEKYEFEGDIDLASAVLKNFKPSQGLDMYVHCDAPPGSGLGSSSTVIVSLIGLFKEWMNKSLTKYDVAKLAYKLERIDLNLKGGMQDQYASSFGGFNFIEFDRKGAKVSPLKISKSVMNELEYRSVLVYTGKTRVSANIIDEHNKRYNDGENISYLDETKLLCTEIKNSLLEENLNDFGNLLGKAWDIKKNFASNVSNSEIDELYETALQNGAIGGKVTGAGGGGFMYLFCDFDKKHQVIESVKKLGAEVSEFSFEPEGLQTWSLNE